jgi:hypothetical protein
VTPVVLSTSGPALAVFSATRLLMRVRGPEVLIGHPSLVADLLQGFAS